MAADAPVLMFSHRLIQNSRKPSQFFHSSMNAVTRPVIARMIRPMGLAAMTALSAVCAAVMAYCARVMPLEAAVAAMAAILNATTDAAIPASATPTAGRLSSKNWMAGTRSDSRAAPMLFTSVSSGSAAAPTSAMLAVQASFASLAAITSLLVSRYLSAVSEYKPLSVSVISACRSCSVLQPSRLAWKSSSDTPAQLRASARAPVRAPVFAVSLAASVKPSMGSDAPKVA